MPEDKSTTSPVQIPSGDLDYENNPCLGATVGVGQIAFCRFPNRAVGDVWGPLFAAAPDHALMLAAVRAGKARWEAWDDARGEVACAGLRYATTLDPFGCPVLTGRLRAELRKAVGL